MKSEKYPFILNGQYWKTLPVNDGTHLMVLPANIPGGKLVFEKCKFRIGEKARYIFLGENPDFKVTE